MSNNLFRVSWKWKNADVMFYILTSLVSLQQGNIERCEKLIKIVNIDRPKFHIFWMIWGISLKFSGKMWTVIILNVKKKQWFNFYAEDTFFEKPQVGVKSTSPRLFGVNRYCQHLNLPTSNQPSQPNQLFLGWLVGCGIFKFVCWLHWIIGLFLYLAVFNFNMHVYIHA